MTIRLHLVTVKALTVTIRLHLITVRELAVTKRLHLVTVRAFDRDHNITFSHN